MGHCKGLDNRKKSFRRRKKFEARLRAWENPTDLTKCVKCDKFFTFDSPYLLCTEHWVRWWATGMKPKTKAQRKKLLAECRKNLSESEKINEWWCSVCSAHQKINISCPGCHEGLWVCLAHNKENCDMCCGPVPREWLVRPEEVGKNFS